jgi:hypothetical protein
MKMSKFLVPILFITAVSNSFATPYFHSSPLDGITPITFDEVAMGVGDVVTDQFSAKGITFGSTVYFDSINTLFGGVGHSLGAISGSHIGNFNFPLNNSFDGDSIVIHFDSIVRTVVFSLIQGTSSNNVTVEAFLNGLLVESFSNTSSCCNSEYWGFTNIQLDELRIENLGGTGDLVIDNLQVSSVPVPAAAWLFCSGLLGLARISCKLKSASSPFNPLPPCWRQRQCRLGLVAP